MTSSDEEVVIGVVEDIAISPFQVGDRAKIDDGSGPRDFIITACDRTPEGLGWCYHGVPAADGAK